MRLTKAEGKVLLGAIRVELESQYWRSVRRHEYPDAGTPAWHDVERGLMAEDQARAEVLRTIRDRIKAQL